MDLFSWYDSGDVANNLVAAVVWLVLGSLVWRVGRTSLRAALAKNAQRQERKSRDFRNQVDACDADPIRLQLLAAEATQTMIIAATSMVVLMLSALATNLGMFGLIGILGGTASGAALARIYYNFNTLVLAVRLRETRRDFESIEAELKALPEPKTKEEFAQIHNTEARLWSAQQSLNKLTPKRDRVQLHKAHESDA